MERGALTDAHDVAVGIMQPLEVLELPPVACHPSKREL